MARKPSYQELESRVQQLERDRSARDATTAVDPVAPYEALVDTIPCALYGYVRWPDGRSRFVYISAQAEQIFGYTPARIMSDPALLWGLVHPDDVNRLKAEDEAANRSGESFRSEVRVVTPDGGLKWIQLTSMPSPQRFESQVLWSGVILDITERKQIEEQKNRLVVELQAALDKIKKLEGIIPICSFCNKIRDEEGRWERVDVFIRRHSQTDFSHSICPACAKEHYPDL